MAQALKSGVLFLFNRETGEPLFPIEERPVPPSRSLKASRRGRRSPSRLRRHRLRDSGWTRPA